MKWAVVSAALLLAGCSVGSSAGDEIVVSAAASLTDAFEEIKIEFEQRNPDWDVALNFGGSSSLREQILEGAPIDVFASANDANMSQVVAAGDAIGTPAVFATNRLAIAVPAGNPAGIDGLDDFANPDLLIGLCAEGVPCGDFARAALRNSGVDPSLDSNEPDVRSLLTKVENGELDAGVVYTSDIDAGGDGIEGIEIPESVNITARYPIVVVGTGANRDGAMRFVDFVLSPAGEDILRRHGFGA